jgi:putative membrane protein insertion efficiency factor
MTPSEPYGAGQSAPGMKAFILDIPRNLLIGIVRIYQAVLSPHMGASCRFTPTCSEYAIKALTTYGAVKGFILATHRIARCNPWGGHGYDPPRWYTEAPIDTSPPADPD